MALTGFAIVRRSLARRPVPTLTTILTVGVAVALMLVLLTMRDAGRAAFERGPGNMHLLVSRDASPLASVLNGVFYAGAPARAMSWDKYEQIIASVPLEWALPTQKGDSYRGLPVIATVPEFFERFAVEGAGEWVSLRAREGRLLQGDFEVVVGAEAARASGLRVGDTLALAHGMGGVTTHEHAEYPFTVVGILELTGSPHDRALFTTLQSSWIIHAHDRREREEQEAAGASGGGGSGHDDHAEHDHEHEAPLTAADLRPEDKLITGIFMRVPTRPGADISAVVQQVFDTLRRDPTILVASPGQQITQLLRIVGNIDQIFIAMGAVVMLSGAIAIMLALYSSMELRRRQVAVLRVLGATRARIFGLAITESAVLGVLGAALGVVLAFAGAQAAALALQRSVGLVINPALSMEWVIVICAASAALACVAGIVPALAAYRTPVAKNLRPIA